MFKPVYALVGSDLFLQLQALREIAQAAPKGAQRIDFDGETAELADVLDEVRSFAMFAPAKIVVVRSADDFIKRFREHLEGFVARHAGESALVLRVESLPGNQRIAKAIAAAGQIIDCNAPKDVAGWIATRAQKAHNMRLGPGAAQLLVELVGRDLGRLDCELAKLALQSDGSADSAAVSASVSFQREQEMWDLTDEVASGNAAKAVQRWRTLVQTDSSAEYRIITWLTIWLEKVRRGLAMHRQGMPEGAIAKELKIWPPDKARGFFRNASAIGEDGAARLINALADLDYRSKSGLAEISQGVERFLLSVKLQTVG